ncbi:penicillin-binding protein [Streptomyces sp. Je 1-4]|uniref:transglycosylase domain-containing protein n=1 Tax=Streptomyces TaxID=1883 RepID=UPI0021D87F7A|nr:MULTISPECIES: transglycosylase domain-containing protein [unclassified Streptomyces]UYB40026.1 penicillin-binding protein [Streptomyces sp. Je 1-4]UZQ36104.1 penicillin-binding protein [Streptomyces sp. Je 1-4] [Streptomyces sp. Je 1-4 4N24]UZQ43522.1 penicillin-binding protein [Streptomyces sp. Je 1-4] [Streptomyces sp. Je 1-4 4N24_ara]
MMGTKGRRRVRRRFLDYPRQGRQGPRRWLPSWRQWLGLLALGVLGLAGTFAVVYTKIDIPGENTLAGQEATVYYWADGSPMVSVGAVNRQNVSLDKVADSVESSVIAAENATFYSDSGVSLKGIGRALVSMVSGGDTQGGSTITQQFVKNTYLSQDQTVTRKVREFIIALKVSNQKSKQDILRGYLNTSWFGRDSYGIEAAAHAYYGVDAKQLNPSQSALLAAVLKGSEQYDPGLSKANHQRAEARWKWILDRQVATGKMSEKQRAKYRTFPEPRPLSKPTSQAGQTGYLIDVANKFVKAGTGLTDKDLARGGYRIHTTFDKQRTRRLEKAVNEVRRKNIDPKHRTADTFVEFGAASVRPKDGALVALYGGADATKHFSNNADTTAVPAGSAFKPFVLAAALQDQVYDQDEANDATAAPGVGPTTGADDLREALVKGQNPPFVQAGQRIGLERLRDLAVDAGLRKESMARLEQTFPLGTSAPSAIRMASAYTTFANGGLHAEPYAVSRMTYDGKKLPGFERPDPEQVLDAEVAQEVSNTLEQVGWRTLGLPEGRPALPVAAGRAEPGDRKKSAWFIGSPQAAGQVVRPGSGADAKKWQWTRPGQAPGAGDGNEPTTAVTMFRNKAGAPQLLPMQGVGGAKSGLGTTIPPKIWQAYQQGS